MEIISYDCMQDMSWLVIRHAGLKMMGGKIGCSEYTRIAQITQARGETVSQVLSIPCLQKKEKMYELKYWGWERSIQLKLFRSMEN